MITELILISIIYGLTESETIKSIERLKKNKNLSWTKATCTYFCKKLS